MRTGGALSDLHQLVTPFELAGQRLDVALVRLLPSLSRTQAQRLVQEGRVRVEGRSAKPSAQLRGGEKLEVEIPDPEPSELVAQPLPLAVLHEDPDIIVLDKAAGMVVHPARGTPHSTVVNALLHRLGEGGAVVERIGLVHRLDKETSGCLVIAKNQGAYQTLQAAFKGRRVEKTYLAICHGSIAAEGRYETPYGRHPRDRKRFTSRLQSERRAVTSWKVRERFGDRASLVEVSLHTGRTHQIRVHFSEHGHPLLADVTYGGVRRETRLPDDDRVRCAAAALGRQALHAWRLSFEHPTTGAVASFEAPLPADFEEALRLLRGSKAVSSHESPFSRSK